MAVIMKGEVQSKPKTKTEHKPKEKVEVKASASTATKPVAVQSGDAVPAKPKATKQRRPVEQRLADLQAKRLKIIAKSDADVAAIDSVITDLNTKHADLIATRQLAQTDPAELDAQLEAASVLKRQLSQASRIAKGKK